jgi:predicted glutamine amidotransferase
MCRWLGTSAPPEDGRALASARASTGTPVQQTNCHLFRDGHWLFVHNGQPDAHRDALADAVQRHAGEQ